ncbi:thioredoxin family protein [Candidatus Nitrosotenuis uzonensis]|uniref:Thioredoxin n=1 Tax=Candidatus Nitrosotenuis uzonensis TaxID=1407055 RepID=A0A812F1X3_9ARCH|nr:thioredoxin family protein [Candidatus Nitrosotenuis uzonensis]CAE6494406.1 Thioredoxin [Candidatus Nitrosotenuis uzonensis]
MKIEILGSGCSKCKELEKRAKEAISRKGLKIDVEHIYDNDKIIERNVFVTPALSIDGKVVVSGRVPSVDELLLLIK